MLEYSNTVPFKQAMDLLKTAIPSAKVSASQAQRLVQHFGNLPEMEDLLQSPGFSLSKEEEVEAPILYIQADGGHLLTDEDYKETKVGRLFAGHHIKQVSSDNQEVNLRNELEHSDYIAHLGSCDEFIPRLNPLIDNHLAQASDTQIVVISDGASWIANWIKRDYPKATLILDFYHAKEKLCEFAAMVFKSKNQRNKWIENRTQDLLDGNVNKVILAIRTKALTRNKSIKEKADNIITYYSNNTYRMQYQLYQKKGYCIGSGAIESAISTVVQQRCKLVGQRWTHRVKAVLNLRAAFKSNKRKEIRTLINSQMGYNSAA